MQFQYLLVVLHFYDFIRENLLCPKNYLKEPVVLSIFSSECGYKDV